MFKLGERVWVIGPYRSMYEGPWEIEELVDDSNARITQSHLGRCASRLVAPLDWLTRQNPDKTPLKAVREHSFVHFKEVE